MIVKKFIVVCVLNILSVLSSNAASLNINGIAGGGNYKFFVTSFVERRFKTIYKQQLDYSCGSAALASLLTFHYEDTVDEQSVFSDMYERGDKNRIQKLGFSLLDMKRYLKRRGYRSNGFKINLDQLINANVPALTIINNKGYLHFVIIKGVSEQEVLVGDPASGLRVMPRDKFVEIWEHRILFLIGDKKHIGGSHFQDEREWRVEGKVALATAIDRRSLALFNVLRQGNSGF
ncbi:MAG TPA: peptidase C39 [Methyloprofundus sp.]|nr:peptidase C39 [Methyloprofundus sp.]